jgi:hypothetical protein
MDILGEGYETMCVECAQSYLDTNKQEHEESVMAARNTQIYVDHSGQGHCWKLVDRSTMNPDVLLEIECEIVVEKKTSCDSFVAQNGLLYKWGV